MEREVEILTMSDVKDQMLYKLRNGLEKGSSTGIPIIDRCWKWRLSEFNILSGFSNEGKSQMFRYLMIIKYLLDGWKFVVSVPEDWPADEFFDDCLFTLVGQSTDKDNPNRVSEEKYLRAYEMLKDAFHFVYIKPPLNTVEAVLEECTPIIKKIGAKGLLLDPLVKFTKPKHVSEKPEEYMAYLTTLLTDYTRRHNLSGTLVIHQVTPKIIESSGLYPEPSMYNIRGGGVVADSVDNVLFVQRPNYAKDKMDSTVVFGSQKIKRQRLVGIPQKVSLRFDRRTNRYTTEEGDELFDFSKYLK